MQAIQFIKLASRQDRPVFERLTQHDAVAPRHEAKQHHNREYDQTCKTNLTDSITTTTY